MELRIDSKTGRVYRVEDCWFSFPRGDVKFELTDKLRSRLDAEGIFWFDPDEGHDDVLIRRTIVHSPEGPNYTHTYWHFYDYGDHQSMRLECNIGGHEFDEWLDGFIDAGMIA